MSVMRRVFCAIALAGSAALAAPNAHANKANDTLTYASNDEPENVSPYHNNIREGVILGSLAWDTLIHFDPVAKKYVPALATGWRWIDPTTLEFDIRDGVKFHNGDPMTADDVVFTLNYVLTPEAKVVNRQNVEWMTKAEKVGDNKVRLYLKSPFPAALEFLASPDVIYPEKYFKKVGIEGFAKAPVGTGPYKIVGVASGKGVQMVKNDDYYAGSPKGKPAIGKLNFRTIPDPEARAAAVMTGEIDWAWKIPHDQAEAMKNAPGLKVLNAETMRFAFLRMDVHNTSMAKSPFSDVRVRRALAMSIDRKAMVENLIGGDARVINTACFPTQTACVQSAAVIYDYNPKKAKELLAEAGYPNGFEIGFNAYRERDTAEAVIGYLKAVGITAKLNFQKYAAMRDDMRAGRITLAYDTWGSFSINDASASTGVFFTGKEDDIVKDPEIIAWLKEADATVDPAKRDDLYAKVLRKISDQVYILPLLSYSADYIFTDQLNFQAFPDELPRFYMASWK